MNKKLPLELMMWSAALILLALLHPSPNHFTLCPLENMGIYWCPGCGLGRSISYLLHGEIKSSIQQHWFGIPALYILIYRILQLLNKFLLNLVVPNRINYGK